MSESMKDARLAASAAVIALATAAERGYESVDEKKQLVSDVREAIDGVSRAARREALREVVGDDEDRDAMAERAIDLLDEANLLASPGFLPAMAKIAAAVEQHGSALLRDAEGDNAPSKAQGE